MLVSKCGRQVSLYTRPVRASEGEGCVLLGYVLGGAKGLKPLRVNWCDKRCPGTERWSCYGCDADCDPPAATLTDVTIV